MKRILYVVATLFAFLAFFVYWGTEVSLGIYMRFSEGLPSEGEILHARATYKASSTLVDRNGKFVARLFTENRIPVTLNRVSPLVVSCVVAAEDADFFSHGGISFSGTLRAFLQNFRGGKISQGGSTITQQLARTLFLSPEKTFERKIREALLSFRIEKTLSKKQILESYLNFIYFGNGAWGIESAARTYFGRTADNLTLIQSAALATSIPAPNKRNPKDDPEGSLGRALSLLERMGYAKNELSTYSVEDMGLRFTPNVLTEHTLYPSYVRHVLFKELIPLLGEEKTYGGGLTIRLAMDSEVQRIAEKTVKGLKDDFEASLVGISPDTGEVLAVVGGRNFENDEFDRAIQSFRQPGSSFKPLVYVTAFEDGASPDDMVSDGHLDINGWKPSNYDNKFGGRISLRSAVSRSRNTPAVRVGMSVGADRVVETSRALGLENAYLPPDPALFLGSGGTSPLEMATAFSAFANGGFGVSPVFITEIKDSKGNVLFANHTKKTRAISPLSSHMMLSVLKNAVEHGTGTRARIKGVEVFGKTGTTNRYTDAWFIGGIPGFVAAVWRGRDDHTPLPKGSTGGHVAAPVWKIFVEESIKILELPSSFPELSKDEIPARKRRPLLITEKGMEPIEDDAEEEENKEIQDMPYPTSGYQKPREPSSEEVDKRLRELLKRYGLED